MMRMSSVAERMRFTSIRMLRGVFTGIGQLLLAADRLRAEAEAELEHADSNGVQDPLSGWDNGAKPDTAARKPRRRPEASGKPAPRQNTGSAAAKRPQRRSLDSTGNVRLLTGEELAEAAKATPAKPRPGKAAKATAPDARPGNAAKSTPAKARPVAARSTGPASKSSKAARPDQPASGPGQPQVAGTPPASAPAPPIPGYGDLSLASLRARMRGLSVGQLSQLADYEKAHANRAEVVTMFERRIAKLGVGEPGR